MHYVDCTTEIHWSCELTVTWRCRSITADHTGRAPPIETDWEVCGPTLQVWNYSCGSLTGLHLGPCQTEPAAKDTPITASANQLLSDLDGERPRPTFMHVLSIVLYNRVLTARAALLACSAEADNKLTAMISPGGMHVASKADQLNQELNSLRAEHLNAESQLKTELEQGITGLDLPCAPCEL